MCSPGTRRKLNMSCNVVSAEIPKALCHVSGCNGCLDICNKLVPFGSTFYVAYGMSDYACSKDAESDFP